MNFSENLLEDRTISKNLLPPIDPITQERTSETSSLDTDIELLADP
jgi:hypothetical protein